MKKALKLCLLPVTLSIMLTACNNQRNSISSSNSISTSSSIDVSKISLKDAIANTREYTLQTKTFDNSFMTFQVFSDNFYYYAPNMGGYIVIEDDPGYVHAFDVISIDSDLISKTKIDVLGRNGLVDQKAYLYAVNFLDIMMVYADDFVRISDNAFCCSVKDLSSHLKDYFQNKNLSYANYFEIVIGDDGRISRFIPYEKTTADMHSLGEVYFSIFNIEEYEPYKLWNQEGRKINTRLYDLKMGYFAEDKKTYIPFYKDEQVVVEGVVSSFDANNNVYISSESLTLGNIGIQVQLSKKDTLPKINELIKVKGTIACDNYVSLIKDATFTVIEEQDYFPYFDEEPIADLYGSGYYAANFFSQSPVFGDSIYSTAAYIYEDFESNLIENKSIEIDMICPAIPSSDKKDYYHMKLVLPTNMQLEEKNQILQSLKEFGIYGNENAKEVLLDKFIIRVDPTYFYTVKLEYGSESSISLQLSPTEKVEKVVGIKDFEFAKLTDFSCYRFGGHTAMSLEEMYGKEGKTSGVYYQSSSMSKSEYDTQISNIESIGFKKINEIRDEYKRRHIIYQKDNFYVDLFAEENTLGEDGDMVFNMWIYKGELIYYRTVQEQLRDSLPFFNVDDFIQMDGVYDADLNYFELTSYAGKEYKNDEHIACVTISTNSDIFSELRSKYRTEKGYTAVRNNDNSIYTYNTRGSNHYVFSKAIDGSNEKVYLDMALYSTDDYTYAGHKDFTNRIEIAIYKGTEPLSTTYLDNLNEFGKRFGEKNGVEALTFNLPANTKVEMYYCADKDIKYSFLEYGYLYQDEAFVYSDSLNETYNAIISSLEAQGYKLSTTTVKGNVCYVKQDGNVSAYIFIMKSDKGYIRLIDGVGGLDY